MKMQQYKIGVVTSRFNSEITEKLEDGAITFLESVGAEILAVRVPGAVEIPLAAQALLDQGCDGVVVCGAVIRGDTSHYDLVCNSVERGITQLMLDYKKPIGFGVITTENDQQAEDRAGGKQGNKGEEAAQVAVEMIGLLMDLKSSMKAINKKLAGKNVLAKKSTAKKSTAKKSKGPAKAKK